MVDRAGARCENALMRLLLFASLLLLACGPDDGGRDGFGASAPTSATPGTTAGATTGEATTGAPTTGEATTGASGSGGATRTGRVAGCHS